MTSKEYLYYWDKSISYRQYTEDLETALENPEFPKKEYLPINAQRMSRVYKKTQVDPRWATLLSSFHWLVITELWCGDSSQITPALARIAEESDRNISLRFIYRDENPELMNTHLTHQSRSIPKLIILNDSFQVINTWGPRPTEAQQLVQRLKSNPETAPKYQNELHLWYARNRQSEIQNELLQLMELI